MKLKILCSLTALLIGVGTSGCNKSEEAEDARNGVDAGDRPRAVRGRDNAEPGPFTDATVVAQKAGGETIVGSVEPGEKIDVHGSFQLRDAETTTPGIVTIQIVSRRANGSLVTEDSRSAEVENQDGRFRFGGSVAAPVKPGRYTLRVKGTFNAAARSDVIANTPLVVD